MPSEAPTPSPGPARGTRRARRARRARWLAALLVAVALVVAVAGAAWFARFAARAGRDPGLVYRDPGTLRTLLRRAADAERAGDRASAAAAYGFVDAVARGGGPELAPYAAAARAGLRRLAAAGTPPGPPR